MHQLLTPAQEIRTDRLLLAPVTPADVDALRIVLGASGRPVPLVDVQHLVQESIGSRVRHGLGPWVVRLRDDDRVVGVGGVTMIDHGVWLLDWQLDAHGLASELAAAAVTAAVRREGSSPIAAVVPTGSDDRADALCRAGLSPAQGTRHVTVWSDRALDADQLTAVLARA